MKRGEKKKTKSSLFGRSSTQPKEEKSETSLTTRLFSEPTTRASSSSVTLTSQPLKGATSSTVRLQSEPVKETTTIIQKLSGPVEETISSIEQLLRTPVEEVTTSLEQLQLEPAEEKTTSVVRLPGKPVEKTTTITRRLISEPIEETTSVSRFLSGSPGKVTKSVKQLGSEPSKEITTSISKVFAEPTGEAVTTVRKSISGPVDQTTSSFQQLIGAEIEGGSESNWLLIGEPVKETVTEESGEPVEKTVTTYRQLSGEPIEKIVTTYRKVIIEPIEKTFVRQVSSESVGKTSTLVQQVSSESAKKASALVRQVGSESLEKAALVRQVSSESVGKASALVRQVSSESVGKASTLVRQVSSESVGKASALVRQVSSESVGKASALVRQVSSESAGKASALVSQVDSEQAGKTTTIVREFITKPVEGASTLLTRTSREPFQEISPVASKRWIGGPVEKSISTVKQLFNEPTEKITTSIQLTTESVEKTISPVRPLSIGRIPKTTTTRQVSSEPTEKGTSTVKQLIRGPLGKTVTSTSQLLDKPTETSTTVRELISEPVEKTITSVKQVIGEPVEKTTTLIRQISSEPAEKTITSTVKQVIGDPIERSTSLVRQISSEPVEKITSRFKQFFGGESFGKSATVKQSFEPTEKITTVSRVITKPVQEVTSDTSVEESIGESVKTTTAIKEFVFEPEVEPTSVSDLISESSATSVSQVSSEPVEKSTTTLSQVITEPAEKISTTVRQLTSEPSERTTTVFRQVSWEPAEKTTTTFKQLVSEPTEKVTSSVTQFFTDPIKKTRQLVGESGVKRTSLTRELMSDPMKESTTAVAQLNLETAEGSIVQAPIPPSVRPRAAVGARKSVEGKSLGTKEAIAQGRPAGERTSLLGSSFEIHPSVSYGGIAASFADHPETHSSTEFLMSSEGGLVWSEEELKRKLKYFFMNPIEKWRAKGKFPWKLILQVVKIIFVTVQLCVFGSDGYIYEVQKQNTGTSFQHMFLKEWTALRDVVSYPPSTGAYAVYTKPEFYANVNHVVKTYANITNIALGTYCYDGPNCTMTYISFCRQEFRKMVAFNQSVVFDSHRKTICHKIPDLYPEGDPRWKEFSIRQYIDDQNDTVSFDKMITAKIKFSLKTIFLKSLGNNKYPDCYRFNITVLYDNKEHDGQVLVSLDTKAEKLKCYRNGTANPEDRLGYVIRQVLNGFIIFICVVSLLLCCRCLAKGRYLCRETNKYFKFSQNKSLTTHEKMEFLDMWYCAMIFNDALIIAASVLKAAIEQRTIEGDQYATCAILLGVGNLLVWAGVLRYLGFFSKYNILILTMKKAIPNVLRFILCCVLLYAGFCFCGWVVLGPYHIKFRSLSTTSECLFAMMNGDDLFATFAITNTNNNLIWWFSRIYLYTFISMFIYVVISLFISVIMDSYETVKDHYRNGNTLTRIQILLADIPEDSCASFYQQRRKQQKTCWQWIVAYFRK